MNSIPKPVTSYAVTFRVGTLGVSPLGVAGVLSLLLVSGSIVSAAARSKKGENLDDHDVLAKILNRSKTLVLYEGLPHPMNEKAVFESEFKTKKSINLRGHRFYDEKIVVEEESREKLRRILVARKSFKEHEDTFCGRFHPDSCLEWSDGKTVCQVLICLTCREIKFASGRWKLYCDMQEADSEALKEILSQFQKSRPQRED